MKFTKVTNMLGSASMNGEVSEFIEALKLCDHYENGTTLEERISRVSNKKTISDLELAGKEAPILDYNKVASYMESIGEVELSSSQREVVNVYSKLLGVSGTKRVTITDEMTEGLQLMVEASKMMSRGMDKVGSLLSNEETDQYESFTEAIVK